MAARTLARIPIALTALRAVLGPVVLLLSLALPEHGLLGACLVLAFVSDVLDGVIARRLGVATPALRRMDSVADTIFYLGAAYAVWRLYPSAILANLPALCVLAALELIRYAFDFHKFRREASYHAWSSKAWGVCLFAGLFGLLALGVSGLMFSLAIWVGILADIEGLAISILLPEWTSDVPSFVHALRIRRASHR